MWPGEWREVYRENSETPSDQSQLSLEGVSTDQELVAGRTISEVPSAVKFHTHQT